MLSSVVKFATFTDAESNPAGVVIRWPDIFVLDRGTQQVYRYKANDAGSNAAPFRTMV